MRRAVLITLSVAALAFLLAWAWLLGHADNDAGKDVTHYVTVDRTIPGPETTVFKRRPGVTTWIIVCGENTQRVEGNKPITECNLPDTSGGR